jgi:hypothetical protein
LSALHILRQKVNSNQSNKFLPNSDKKHVKLRDSLVQEDHSINPEKLLNDQEQARLIIAESELFDAVWYQNHYDDLKNLEIDFAEHYLKFGWKQGKAPSLRFSSNLYIRLHADVAKLTINPLVHYEKVGKAEGRITLPYNIEVIFYSEYFDSDYYCQHNNLVDTHKLKACIHYLTNTNRAAPPSAYFNSSIYLDHYPDVAKEGLSPLLHFELYGKKEGRTAGISNPSSKYLDAHYPENISSSIDRVCLFACYMKDGLIPEETIYLLESLRKVTQAIVLVGDCGIRPSELEKLKDIVCYVKFERHLEYDFGSYKRAFQYAEDTGLLEHAKEILICNDSIIGPCGNIDNFFVSRHEAGNPDFYGITVNNFGFRDTTSTGNSIYSPHVQSYFFTITRKIFRSEYWREFIYSVKKEQHKVDIIKNYEMGMSALLQAHGHAPTAMYRSKLGLNPAAREPIDVLNQALFLKKSMTANLSAEKTGNINGIFKAKGFPFQLRGKQLFSTHENQATPDTKLHEKLKLIDGEIKGNAMVLLAVSEGARYLDLELLISSSAGLQTFKHDADEATNYQELINHYSVQSNNLYVFKFPLPDASTGASLSFSNANRGVDIIYLNGAIPCYNFLKHRQTKLLPRIEANRLLLQPREQSIASIMLSENYTQDDKSVYAAILNSRTKPSYKLFAERGTLACDNAYELFKYSLEKDSNCYYITSKEVIEKERNPKIKKNLIQLGSNKHKELFINSKSLFCSFGYMNLVHAGLKDIHINVLPHKLYLVWHGISAGDKNSAEIAAINTHSCHAVAASSTYEAENFKKLGHEKVVLTGYPRMDKWHNDEKLQKNMLVLFFTWRKSLLNATLEEFMHSKYVQSIVELVEQISKKRPLLDIYYFIHNAIPPQHSDCLAAVLRAKSSRIRFVNNSDSPTFNKLFNTAQYLITDYSSVAYDFSYHKKRSPIFYTPPGFTEGHYVTTPLFDKIKTGTQASDPGSVISALKTTEHKKYAAATHVFFPHMDDKNCSRTYDAFVADSPSVT